VGPRLLVGGHGGGSSLGDEAMKVSSKRAVVAVALLASLLWVALIFAVAGVKFGGDPRGLLFLGQELHHPAAMDGIPRCGRFGFDGQFYAALATDPFLRSPETLKALDAPGYRASRILLPLLAWSAGLGNARTAIVAYQLLCWVLGVAAVGLAAAWLRREGGSPWLALVLAFNAGLVTAMFRSTPDGAAAALVVATLMLHSAGRHGAGVAAAALATLARETGIIAALACAVEEFAAGNARRGLRYLLIPVVPQVVWQGYVQHTWHPTLRWPGAISAPLAALVRRAGEVLREGRVLQSQEFWALVGVVATIAAGALVLARRRRLEAPRLALAAFAVVAACLSAKMYVEAYSSARALTAAPFVALVLATREGGGWSRALLVVGPVAFALSGVLMIAGELGLL